MSAGGEKTEKPSTKKLRDARKQGNFARSQDIPGVLVLGTVCAALMLGLPAMFARVAALSGAVDAAIADPAGQLPRVLDAAEATLAAIVLPILGLACALAVAGVALQVGFSVSGERLRMSLDKINPVNGARNLFKLRKLFDLAKSLLAVGLIGGAIVLLFRQNLNDLVHLPQSGLYGVLLVAGAMFRKLIAFVVPLFVAIAALDYLFKHFVWMKDLKMSKEELKRERISQDGNPMFKSRRRRVAKEWQRPDNLESFPNASLVLHDASGQLVAVYYDASQAPLPVVLCKAQGTTAADLLAQAAQTGMRVHHDDVLTKLLYLRCQLNEFVPEEAAADLGTLLRT